MRVQFAKELYPKAPLLKAAYNYTNRAYVHLDATETHYVVEIVPKKGFEEVSEGEFENEMLCQSVRHEVYRQTKTIRELLTARAMASTVLKESDCDGELEQPVEAVEEDILSDWFEATDGSEAE